MPAQIRCSRVPLGFSFVVRAFSVEVELELVKVVDLLGAEGVGVGASEG